MIFINCGSQHHDILWASIVWLDHFSKGVVQLLLEIAAHRHYLLIDLQAFVLRIFVL